MSEVSYLRERARSMRSAMDCSDLPDAIDTVLDHLFVVEGSRVDALNRVTELELLLEAVTDELGITTLAYEMSETLRTNPDQRGDGDGGG